MLNSLMHKHDRFDGAAYVPLSIFCNTMIEIFEPDPESNEWDIENGLVQGERKPVWRGWAAVTPNMDWRARDRRSSYDDTAIHAYRVQLWHIDKNLLLPREEWGEVSNRVDLMYGQIVKVVTHNSDPMREGMQLVVRNATTDSDWWQPTLLCDVDTGDLHGKTH